MPQAPPTDAICPGCGRRFRLRAQAIGKKVKCNCGMVFIAESAAGDASGRVSASDLELDAPAPPSPTATPPADGPPAARPFAPGTRTHASPVAASLSAGEDEAQESTFRENWLPLGLLIIGLIAGVALWAFWLPTVGAVATVAVVAILVQAILFAPAMLASLALLAKWFDVALGDLRTVMRKIAAISVGSAASADVLFTVALIVADFDWQIVVAGFGFYLILLGIPAAILFEVGVAETAFLVAINFFVRVGAAYPAAVVLHQAAWIR